jgi:2-hydroxychromene-2-carboxylate isomerase
MSPSPDLEFFFDPICPFAWVTSRWVADIADQRGLDVQWRFIALAIVNADTDYSKFPPAYPALHGLGRDMLRVAAAVRGAGGNDAVAAFYTAAGKRMHLDGVSAAVFTGEPIPADLISGIVADAGLGAWLAAAATDDSYDALLREETELALSRTGRDVGTPILGFVDESGKRVGFFGPVISRRLPLDAGLRLWDGLMLAASVEGFWEMKRTRTEGPDFTPPA